MVQLIRPGGKRPVFPLSAKALIPLGGKVVLLQRPGGKWDLPGGKLAAGDRDIEACLIRECTEELGFAPVIERLLAVRIRRRNSKPDPFISFFLCAPAAPSQAVTISGEHVDHGAFAASEIARLEMIEPYREVLAEYFAMPTNAHIGVARAQRGPPPGSPVEP
jgi:8-oxo-dGTP pyrophosphatase MutT (NUDIX family)